MKKTVWIINQYASTPETGIGGRHYYLARELAKQGYNVTVVAAAYHHLLRKPPKFSGLFKREEIEGFIVVWVKMPSYTRAQSKWRVFNWVLFSSRLHKLKKIMHENPDTIVYSSPALLAFMGAKRLAKHYKARLIFEVRDIWPLTLKELGGYKTYNPIIFFMQWVEDMAYRYSDRVVSNLKNSYQHMVSRGMKPEKFAWVPNGFSLDEVNQHSGFNEKITESLPRDKFLVGYTGTIGVANDLITLVEAACILREEEGIGFVIVGSGQEKSHLQTLVKQKNLTNIVFIDPIPKVQIQAMLNEFSVCYIGLTKDPLFRFGVSPNKLFDYLYSAKPIIYAIDSGDYRPVEDAGAGYQIESQNPEMLANAILRLYETPQNERDEMGKKGRQEALENYEYQKLAKKLAEVIFGAEK